MTQSAPAPPLVLTEWPVITPAAPLGPLDLPDQAGELRALAPTPQATAWQTALTVLDWASHRWQVGRAHMETDDTVECLRRAGEGERFACMEYSLVLAQALNALGIPARRRLASAHPYGQGFSADGNPLPSAVRPLDRGPGDHELMLAARTGYATLPGKPLRYRVEA
jgi:hypothetical protein